ncbi:enoyl-CoA hydratase/isomerase family protein [Chloroflexota bacterium]
MKFSNITVEKRDRIVCLTINRPERMNAIDMATSDELVRVFTEYRDNQEEWAMIITGAGEKAFSTGADMKDAATGARERKIGRRAYGYRPWTDLMQSIYKPFICAVNGYCLGGGWHLVADSDIIIASDNAIFMDTHVNVGLINGVESSGLAWKMPRGIVLRMVLEGRHFQVNAQQAYQWGLVSEVVPPPHLMPRAWEIARHIVEESAPLAVWGSKEAMVGAIDRGFHSGIDFAWSVLPDVLGTEDEREGPRAFVEKRKPNFKGR